MLLCLILGIFLGLTCAADRQNHATQVDEESFYPTVNFSDTFDLRLLKEFARKQGNVLLSPISLKITLALLYQGSNGLIEKEFKDVLQFVDKRTVNDNYRQVVSKLQGEEKNEYLLNMGMSIFLDSQIPINPDFESKAYRYYRTEIKPVNFTDSVKASRIINYWVDEVTNGKVSEIVETGDLQQTIMLITNAVYFRGIWQHQFPEKQTHVGNFFVNTEDIDNIEIVTVRYLSTTDTFFIKDSVELDSKILRLPYKDSDYSMFIILPNSFGGLPNLISRINPRTLSSALTSMEKRLVDVHIPKLKFSFNTKLAEVLRNVGFHQMFENPASFTRITKGNNGMLVVSDIIQKSGIELDEEGSVVYSATGVNIGNKFGERKDVFHATHPFLFFIEGPGGSILFIGKIENPLGKELAPTPTTQQSVLNSAAAEVFTAPKPFSTAINQHESPESVPPTYSDFPDYQPSIPNQAPNLEPVGTDLEPIDTQELLHGFNLFDVELLNLFSETTTNVFVSPASIKTTLAMILEGAQGSCAREISEALRIPNIKHKGVRTILMGILNALKEKSRTTYLESSNGIFVSTKFRVNDKYHKIINQFYGGAVNRVNFKNVRNAVNLINNWVAEATEDNIKEIVGPQSISSDTTAVIVNALFFRGKWKNAFDSETTKTKCFHTQNGCVPVSMMRLSSIFNYNYISQLKAHVVEIPYENNFSMLILLPSGDANVRTVIRNLPLSKLSDILNSLKPSEITLEIPKFRFDYSADLVENLKALKIREIFGSQANLSGIVEDGNVIVNSLLHKTRIEVDEQGTVAAAATGAVVIPLMGSTSIIADRPFIFCIYHRQTIIFEGILMNPEETSSGSFAFK